jgi:hypothetical protein
MSVETIFDWKPAEEKSVFGNIRNPIAIVEIMSKSNEWEIFYPLVDSGAVVTLFNESDCELLGLNLTDGIPFKIKAAFGQQCQAYIHQVTMKIGKDTISSRIAFTEGQDHKQYLGRIDVFDHFQICLKGKPFQTSFLRESHSHQLAHIQ